MLDLKPGKKYLVTYLGTWGQRREVKCIFLEVNKLDTYIFDGRPDVGNLYFRRQDIVDAQEVKS